MGNTMGFLDYAWSISLQKDDMKAGIQIDKKIQRPILLQDTLGFKIILPVPVISGNEGEEKKVSFIGYTYLANNFGIENIGRIFRACVFHLTALTTSR